MWLLVSDAVEFMKIESEVIGLLTGFSTVGYGEICPSVCFPKHLDYLHDADGLPEWAVVIVIRD